ncbi:MAG: hypothetical protein MK324_07305 [Pirellulales bacterium]|nr:hypothetical protein [Pirellulales bacterium]
MDQDFHSLRRQPDLTLDEQVGSSAHDLFFNSIKVLHGFIFNDRACLFL